MLIDRRKFVTAILGTTAVSSLCALSRSIELDESKLARRLATDPNRPQFHLLPAAKWMNDPNGPIYWNDNYHMFYQYNPNGAFWGDMHWGHAVSKDMIHWRHLPIALSPTPGGPDAAGCFTGTAAVRDGQVVMMYTGVHAVPENQATIRDGAHSLRETQCLAIASDPDLTTWTKLSSPVIASPPPGMEVNGFRDPSPWKLGDWWYMVLGSGIEGEGGAVLLYRSKDLRSWDYVHILASRSQNGAGELAPFDPWEVWECPEFFALGDKHVLICSTGGKAYWQSGVLDAQSMRFDAEQGGILDYGSFYAPKSQLDKSGNRILWGWIQEARPLEEYKAAGWAGLLSLPRVLSLGSNGRLKTSVAAEVNMLRNRGESLHLTDDESKNRQQINAMRIEDCCGEILCTARRSKEPFELTLRRASANESPWLTLKYDPLHPDQIFLDDRPISLALHAHECIEIHVYADSSVLEVLVNQQAAWTKRFYYAGAARKDLLLEWSGKTAEILSLTVWQMSSISADRLTT